MKLRIGCVVVGLLLFVLSLAAQNASSGSTSSQVPPLMQFSNVATDEGGNSLSGVVSLTFSLYAAQQGGEPLWTETQNNVPLDPTGHYSVQLGITKPGGLPTTLFTSGEARWLGVRVAEQAEQPRVLLLSVPYALKAGDAATIGGLPPSAFVLAGQQNGSPSTYVAEAPSDQGALPSGVTDVTTTGGVANYLPLFNGTSTIIDSVLFQSGSGSTAKIGIGNTSPAATLDVTGGATIRGLLNLPAAATATASAGADSRPLGLVAAAYNSGSLTSTNQVFHWQAEPVGNDTASPSATLNLLFATAPAAAAETGLHIASNGQITFAAGQTFPGTGTGDGTITGVTAGTDLTGGGSNGTVRLNVDTTKIPQLGAANTFTANQTVNGILSGTSTAFGVAGSATAGSGFSAGVAGTAASPGGYGIEGVNTSSGGIGVYGYDSAGTGVSAYGVTGVYGNSASGSGYGVEGVSTATSGLGVGVYGSGPFNGVSGSSAEWGVSGTSTGGVPYAGVLGGGSTGVKGLHGSGSVTGENFYQSGVWGDGGTQAVLGTNDEAIAGQFINNDSSGNYPALVAVNDTTATHNPVFQTDSPNTYSGSRHCTIDTSANLTCTGVLTGSIQVGDGTETAVYAMQSAENWLEDAGSGQLSGGSARIELDPAFARTVNAGVEYHVFLTPNGDSKGLYVSQKTATSFEVHEQGGGTSSIAFDYRIMAKRKGYENVRLEDLTGRFKEHEPAQKTRHPLPSAGAGPAPKPPTPPFAALRPAPITPKLLLVPPVRSALQPLAAQPK